jgi:hypothetical protein
VKKKVGTLVPGCREELEHWLTDVEKTLSTGSRCKEISEYRFPDME